MRRRVTFRPSAPAAMLSLFVGICFVLLGIFWIIPSAGPFGILWTVVSAGITAANVLPYFTDKKSYRGQVIIDEEDEGEGLRPRPSDAEQRLRELLDLYNKGLITRDEYDQKRDEIIKEL